MSSSTKDKLALMREWAKLQKTINVQYDEQQYEPTTSSGAIQKAQAVVAMQRRSSEEDEDRFIKLYEVHGLIQPVFPFHGLWRLREESDTLSSCIQSMVDNCALPHEFEFGGDDKTEKQTDENAAILKSLRQFFSRVNEKESFLTVRKKVMDDQETTGNGFMEVLRNLKGFVERLYYSPSTHMRITRLDDEETPITLKIPRNGRLETVTWGRRFRRFARIDIATNVLCWFKEFGDPRIVDSTTGEYVKDNKGNYVLENSPLGAAYPNKATEIWWFKSAKAGEPYGLPRWIPALHNVVGRYIAQWINRSHLDKGAIPPFALVPKGGSFTPKQIEEIRKILEAWKTPGAYNDPIVLDIKPNQSFSFDKGATQSQTGVELIKLRDPKDEDFMFEKYLNATEDAIRKSFLLPPLYIGSATDYSNAVSYTSIVIAENQIFNPVKQQFDEQITTELLQQEFDVYDWKFKTGASKVNDREIYYRAVNTISRSGGLSINQAIQLGNDLFGSDFSTHKGALYDEPWAIVQRLVAPGFVKLEDGEFQFINPQPGLGLPLELQSPDQTTDQTTQTEPTPEQTQTTPDPSTMKDESTEDSIEKDARNLFMIMSRIEERGYQAPEINEATYEL